jgi:2',3'-cyclic-nucleotide 2'-phosphodiesterase (5'-nucleotidase family)
MPVGDLVADAFYATARRFCNGADRPCPDAAFENAGAIRYETKCGPRDLIPAGRIYQGDIQQMLPFASDKMAIYEITGIDLKLALEHSVELLGRGRNSEQGGFFLQVSRLKFEVDCAQAPQARDLSGTSIETPGSRIVDGTLMIRTDPGGPNDAPVWTPVVVDQTHTYKVVTNNFIGSGNDGFLALVARTPGSSGETAIPGPVDPCISDFVCKHLGYVTDNGANLNDAQMVEDYLKQQSKVAPVVESRIVIRPSCFIGD